MQTDILVRFGSILPILRKLVFSWKIGPYNFVVLSSPNVLEKTEKKRKIIMNHIKDTIQSQVDIHYWSFRVSFRNFRKL